MKPQPLIAEASSPAAMGMILVRCLNIWCLTFGCWSGGADVLFVAYYKMYRRLAVAMHRQLPKWSLQRRVAVGAIARYTENNCNLIYGMNRS